MTDFFNPKELIGDQMDLINGLRKAIGFYSDAIERRGVVVEDECGDYKLNLAVDKDVIKNTCQALIDNAVKNNRPNGKIVVYLLDDPLSEGVVIADTGCGMKPDKIRLLKDAPGLTGFGKVKELMTLTNGQWQVESQINVGTQVTLFWSKKY